MAARLRFQESSKSEPTPPPPQVRPTSPGDRKWEGDTGGLLVTYRSCAGTVKYLYPFLTPISDGGLQSKRLQRLREELGYRLVGCELVECFPQGQ